MSGIIRISDARLEELIAEDVPYIDLTTHILGIGEALGAMEYYTRENCVLCCTEEVARMATMLNLTVEWFEPSGTKVEAGRSFMRVRGSAANLHLLWKVGLICLGFAGAASRKSCLSRRVPMTLAGW